MGRNKKPTIIIPSNLRKKRKCTRSFLRESVILTFQSLENEVPNSLNLTNTNFSTDNFVRRCRETVAADITKEIRPLRSIDVNTITTDYKIEQPVEATSLVSLADKKNTSRNLNEIVNKLAVLDIPSQYLNKEDFWCNTDLSTTCQLTQSDIDVVEWILENDSNSSNETSNLVDWILPNESAWYDLEPSIQFPKLHRLFPQQLMKIFGVYFNDTFE
ncbi:uncharacterized protein [Diabrotica undecimpunctata]|uniref:uncharacterized protein n=1 Tax=Diabrotica undecimpunctata TaxID=50387 RepID=UPI003B63A756